MKPLAAAVLMIALVGCKQAEPPKVLAAPKPNATDRIMALAKAHPALQKICDVAGGCDKVTVTCTEWDGKGNTNLRNEVEWQIEALGATGYGFRGTSGKGREIEAAASKWWRDRDENEADARREKDVPRVYPNSKPCDEKCGGAK